MPQGDRVAHRAGHEALEAVGGGEDVRQPVEESLDLRLTGGGAQYGEGGEGDERHLRVRKSSGGPHAFARSRRTVTVHTVSRNGTAVPFTDRQRPKPRDHPAAPARPSTPGFSSLDHRVAQRAQTSTRSIPPSFARFTYSGIQFAPSTCFAISTTM